MMKQDLKQILPIGKLDSDLLKSIVFDKIHHIREEVVTTPDIGEDCASVDFGEYICTMSTDPITAAVSDIGSLAIHITCNDIASNGVEPLGIMLTAMLPEGTTAEDIANIMQQAGETAKELNVEILGGHTEITNAVNKPVIVSTAIGRAFKNSKVSNNIKVGDYIVLTKHAGLEGAAIIVNDFEKELYGVLSPEEIHQAKGFIDDISVVKEGIIAGNVGVAKMHDVTEGGVYGAIWEMCHIAGLGCEVYEEEIVIDEITKKIAKNYGIDPYRLISSGCMLIIVEADKKDELTTKLTKANIDNAVIGKIVEQEEGVFAYKDSKKIEIFPPVSDELYKVVG